jgi:hypothetical protein
MKDCDKCEQRDEALKAIERLQDDITGFREVITDTIKAAGGRVMPMCLAHAVQDIKIERDKLCEENAWLRKKINAVAQHVSDVDIEKVIHPLPPPFGEAYISTWFGGLIEILKEEKL